MEKRFVPFLLASMGIMLGYLFIHQKIHGPPPGDGGQDVVDAARDVDAPDQVARDAPSEEAGDDRDTTGQLADEPAAVAEPIDHTAAPADQVGPAVAAVTDIPDRRIAIGSLDPTSPYNLLVIATNRGAAIERIELNNPRFGDIEDKSGYLGHLSLEDDPKGGCRITVVGPGTPAAKAVAADRELGTGLRGPTFSGQAGTSATLQTLGDRIVSIDGESVTNVSHFAELMKSTRPGQQIQLRVERATAIGGARMVEFTVTLAKRPVEVVRSELQFTGDAADDAAEVVAPDLPLRSFLLTLHRIGDREAAFGDDEIKGLPSLFDTNWEVVELPAVDDQRGPGVEFRRVMGPTELDSLGVDGTLEIVKRFRLARAAKEDARKPDPAGYGLTMEIEVRNLGREPTKVAYRLDGPLGLPMEGWWYSNKVHPRKFSAAGARDIAWRSEGKRHELYLCGKITKQAEEDPKNPYTPMFDSSEPIQMQYVGGDAQFFAVVLQPGTSDDPGDPFISPANYRFDSALAKTVGPLDEQRRKRTEVTFRLQSREFDIQPGDALQQRFTVFAGPKDTKVLERFGLEEVIVYGWFGPISRRLMSVLHFFYRFTRNYGISIILLTVLVRGCMFPLGRKMALNAQKMQELAPEMKKIAEKYKNDMEKRTQAQRELFSKNNYNPFSGCLVMFFQIPIFIGLYRALSVDVALRQAPLIPGLSWCSNLAGPDMLLYWANALPQVLSAKTGWLGPYLNILPLVTCGLFMMHQKLFTPPPTDDQQKMQQQIMKFMMLFMGVMFFKVASGLCIYFIASSLWGLAERVLLPKSKKPQEADGVAKEKPTPVKVGSNGTDKKKARRKQRRR